MRLLNLLPPITDSKIRDEWKGKIVNAQPVLDLVVDKLKSCRDSADHQFTSIKRHSDPGYPHSLSDYAGYKRAMNEIINLLEESKDE